MKSLPAWFALIALPSLAVAPILTAQTMPALIEAPAKGDKEGGQFVFSLTPKAFQKEPLLDFNVLTEMTTDGRKRAKPTAEAPQYFMIEGGGMKEKGEIVGGVKPPPAEKVRLLVLNALSKQHYLEAGGATSRATLAIIYHWGTHESPAFMNESGSDETLVPTSGDANDLMLLVLGDVQKRKLLIDRAALVGGGKFAVELNTAMNDEAAFRRANAAATRSADAMGMSSLEVTGLLSPFHRFVERDAQTRRLVEECFGGLFYVIISAFDYDSISAGKPLLLWRTKMSVNSAGVSMVETIQPLIVAGRDFIGKETDGGILIARKISRTGTVKIGEAEVEEYLDAEPAAGKGKKSVEPLKK